MTEREVVRTAIVVGGIWLIFSALASIASMFVRFAEMATRVDQDLSDSFGDLLLIYLPAGLLGVVFGALPGVYAISSSYRWSERLTEGSESPVDLQPSLFLAVGSMLLGISIGVSGAISVAAAGLSLALLIPGGTIGDYIAQGMVQQAVYGGLSLLAGVLLFRWGGRGVLRAA